jgi:hypothetical protein
MQSNYTDQKSFTVNNKINLPPRNIKTDFFREGCLHIT